jgi:hypothetical protein
VFWIEATLVGYRQNGNSRACELHVFWIEETLRKKTPHRRNLMRCFFLKSFLLLLRVTFNKSSTYKIVVVGFKCWFSAFHNSCLDNNIKLPIFEQIAQIVQMIAFGKNLIVHNLYKILIPFQLLLHKKEELNLEM